MAEYDLVVVGAGPGGSAAAAHAAAAGIKTLLVDRAEFPREKTCGDALTPRAVSEIQRLDLEATIRPQGHPVRQVRVVSPSGYRTQVQIPRSGNYPAYGLVVPRLALDAALLRQAVAWGADFRSSCKVTELEIHETGVQLEANTGRIPARSAVLATGAAMPLLKNAGLMAETPSVVRAIRGYYEVSGEAGERMDFRFDNVPLPGYGWVFPVAPGVVNAGLGVWPGRAGSNKPVSLRQALDRMVGSSSLKADFGSFKPVEPVKSYPLRTDFLQAKTFERRVMLVGEAAGLVNPLTGEGIDYALESGRIAAEFLARHGFEADFSGYAGELANRFRGIFKFSGRVQRMAMGRLPLDLLTRLAGRRPDLRELLTNLLLGTVSFPERIPPVKAARKLLGF